MRLAGVFALCVAVTVASTGSGLATQAPTPFGRVTKPKFQKFVSPIGNFELEYPAKDWTLVAGRGETILTLAETRSGAAVVTVERQALRSAFAASDLPTLVTLEVSGAKERERTANDVQSVVLETDKRPVVAVSYVRTGVKGRESTVSYAIPIGDSVYRLVCSVVEKEAGTYLPIFGHIAASLQPPSTAKR